MATNIKNKLNVQGGKRQQGLSWTEKNGKIYVNEMILHLFKRLRNILFRNLVLMIDLIQKHQ